ncbi:MAG TPA: ClpXP protease specificity-enhancing factor SspB [Thermoanaerobaculia bacterium]|nr:ClpXP protease specificity-enhancing factor SspB [Thermoanaerobaculia bacterium]
METERLDYQKILQDALRDAVRRILALVAEHGPPGDHFFYLGFRTDRPGVEIPRFLRDQFPEEMTIVLQNQFWDLEVAPEAFSVTLTFNGSRQRLTVPFQALTAFVDPSAEFGLRFDGGGEGGLPASGSPAAELAGTPATPPTPPTNPPGPHRLKPAGEVVPFDPSRRK